MTWHHSGKNQPTWTICQDKHGKLEVSDAKQLGKFVTEFVQGKAA
jgi:hypothetical protein